MKFQDLKTNHASTVPSWFAKFMEFPIVFAYFNHYLIYKFNHYLILFYQL